MGCSGVRMDFMVLCRLHIRGERADTLAPLRYPR
jgi:hypothetical protein